MSATSPRTALIEGPIARTLFFFTLPILASNVLQSLNGSVNAIWVGHYLGEAALTATSNANTILFFLLALVFVFSAIGQALNAFGSVDRGRGEAGEGLQGVEFDRLETFGVEGVEGDQPPEFFIDKQRTAEAIVDFQMLVEAIDQAVIRIGQVAVGRAMFVGLSCDHI